MIMPQHLFLALNCKCIYNANIAHTFYYNLVTLYLEICANPAINVTLCNLKKKDDNNNNLLNFNS